MAENEVCPFLVSVIDDRLWLYPVSAYCTSGTRIRVPGPTRIAEVCGEPAHLRCPGYLAAQPSSARNCLEEALGPS